MISLRRKITIPYVCIIVAIPLFIMLLFNITMHYFSAKQAVNDLQGITRSVEQGLKFTENRNTSRSTSAVFIRARNLSTSSELFLYTEDGKSVNPYDYALKTFLRDRIKQNFTPQDEPETIPFSRKLFDESIAQTALAVAKGKNNGEIYIFSENNRKYHALKYTITMQNAPMTAIFISAGDFPYAFTLFANMILLVASFLIVGIAIFISKYVVQSISQPIEYITNVVDHAEKDKFITLENNSHIEEIKILSEKINTMSKNGYDHAQAQKSFFQNASHELRTPLTNIQGFAEGLEHGIFTDVPKYTRIIRAEVKRLSDLVNDILSLSRIESDILHDKYVCVSALQAVRNIAQIVENSSYAEAVSLKVHCIADEQIYIVEELLYQGISNIIVNAFRYAKTCVSVTVNVKNEFVVITVSDDGDGVSAEDKPHIFDKFYKGKGGNFGLGLTIAQSAIESMRGTVSLENSIEGASFVVSLPRHSDCFEAQK